MVKSTELEVEQNHREAIRQLTDALAHSAPFACGWSPKETVAIRQACAEALAAQPGAEFRLAERRLDRLCKKFAA